MNRRLLLASPLAIAGCATAKAIGEATGVLDAKGEISLYGFAKGLAEVALLGLETFDPAATAIIAAIELGQKLLAQVQAGSDATALSVQTKTIQLLAAPHIIAVASNSPAAEAVEREPALARRP